MFGYKFDPACAISSVPELIMNGGYSDATWTTDDGETFGNLPPMPLELHDHCAVALGRDSIDTFFVPESGPEPCPSHVWNF